MNWYSLTNLNNSLSDEITAQVRVFPDSPWFSGHFPGGPILPGIAQLSMVLDAIVQQTGKKYKITGLKKVRFKQIIKPDDLLIISATPDKGNPLSYAFSLTVRGEVACSGICKLSNE